LCIPDDRRSSTSLGPGPERARERVRAQGSIDVRRQTGFARERLF
jgi:hypothetical protein